MGAADLTTASPVAKRVPPRPPNSTDNFRTNGACRLTAMHDLFERYRRALMLPAGRCVDVPLWRLIMPRGAVALPLRTGGRNDAACVLAAI